MKPQSQSSLAITEMATNVFAPQWSFHCPCKECIKVGLLSSSKGDNDLSESWEVGFILDELCFLLSTNKTQIWRDLIDKLSLKINKVGGRYGTLCVCIMAWHNG